jgi:hypothetical protein
MGKPLTFEAKGEKEVREMEGGEGGRAIGTQGKPTRRRNVSFAAFLS